MGEYVGDDLLYVPDDAEVGADWSAPVAQNFVKIGTALEEIRATAESNQGGNDALLEGTAFESMDGFFYAHSFGTLQGTGNSQNVSNTNSLYPNRIKARLLMNSMTIRATAGYWANDVATSALVGAAAWTPGKRGLVLWDATENDLISDGGTARGLLGYSHAVRSFLWTMFTDTRVEHTDPSFTFPVGTWADETAAAEFSGGTANSSDTANAKCSISYTGTDAVLFLGGRQDGETVSSVVVNGGTAEIKVDGVVVKTQALGNQFVKSTSPAVRARGPVAVPLLNMGSGTHTIEVTNVGTAGTRLTVDAIGRVSATPPYVLMFKQNYFPDGHYVNFSTPAGVDALNAALIATVAEFVNYPVAVVPNSDFDPVTMFSIAQRRHPNDYGSKWYATKAIDILKTVPFRSGINNL